MHSEKKLWLHFLPVLTAAVVITLLSMITSVGIPYITDSFGLTSRQAPWINTAGTMASAVLAPLLGWVGDRRGVRTQLQIGILCAAVSNLICAFTDSFLIFCLGRFLGGISLAAALPAAMKYISLQFPEEKKVGGFAVLAACICIGSGLGPAIVGLALSKIVWRNLFLLSEIPLVLLGLCVWLSVSGPYGEPRRSKPDVAGMMLLFFGVGALLALLTLTTQYSWNGILLPALLAVSLICLACFYRREKKTPEPVLDVSLLTNRRFIIPALTGFFIYGVKCYCCTAVPYYFTQGLPVHGFRELVDSVLSVRVSALARAESNQPPFYDASVGGVRVGDMVGKRGDASFVLGRYAALGLLPVRRDFQCRHCHPWRHAQRLCAENRTGGAIWHGIRCDFHHLQSGCCHDLCCADPSFERDRQPRRRARLCRLLSQNLSYYAGDSCSVLLPHIFLPGKQKLRHTGDKGM